MSVIFQRLHYVGRWLRLSQPAILQLGSFKSHFIYIRIREQLGEKCIFGTHHYKWR